jgi:hypothetical protein
VRGLSRATSWGLEALAARGFKDLPATMGRFTEACAHFERALMGNAALKAPVWLAHTQLDYASALIEPDAPGGSQERGRAERLVDAAVTTARELDPGAVGRRAAELRGRLRGR